MKKVKTIKIDEKSMAEEKTIKLDQLPIPDQIESKIEIIGLDDALLRKIDKAEYEVSKLISSVKQLQRQERIDKRRRWKNAVKCGKHFH